MLMIMFMCIDICVYVYRRSPKTFRFSLIGVHGLRLRRPRLPYLGVDFIMHFQIPQGGKLFYVSTDVYPVGGGAVFNAITDIIVSLLLATILTNRNTST